MQYLVLQESGCKGFPRDDVASSLPRFFLAVRKLLHPSPGGEEFLGHQHREGRAHHAAHDPVLDLVLHKDTEHRVVARPGGMAALSLT